MYDEKEINKIEEEVRFYRKMLLELTKNSENWKKTFKFTTIIFTTILITGFITVGFICNLYLSYAYNDSAIEKSNTSTSKNININENK